MSGARAAAHLAFTLGVLRAFARDDFLRRIAWRNVWRNGRRTAVVLTAIAVGLAGTVVSMAINFGMVLQMVETAISTDLGHIQIHAAGYEDDPGLARRLADGGRTGVAALDELARAGRIDAWAPRVRSDGLITSPRASAGVRVVAIDPEREAHITVLAESVVEGAYLDGEARRILIGEALAERLQARVGSKLVLSATDVSGDLAGEAFRVAGLFRTSSLNLDKTTVYLRLSEAQGLFSLGEGISELVVRADRGEVEALQAELAKRLGDEVEVRNWEQLAPLLVYFVDMFDQMAWIVYAAVFIAMAFGIANVLLMSVFERTREIGVISSIGMSAPRIVAMVAWESLMLTLVGLLAGFALSGVGLFWLRDGIDLSRWSQGLNAMDVGSTIVPAVRWGDLLVPTAVATLTGVLAGLWPAVRASRGRPADALRHV